MLKIATVFLGLLLCALPGPARAGESPAVEFNANFGKVLIIYYTLSNNTRLMAEVIQGYTGADMYLLETINPYPPIPELYQYAKQELERGDWPELQTGWPDFSDYDVIFVGGPVWWYTVPPPLLSFLRQVDFKGKPVVPFCSHGGNYGAFFERFSAEAQNARVLAGLDFQHPLDSGRSYLKSKVAEWLSGLQVPASK